MTPPVTCSKCRPVMLKKNELNSGVPQGLWNSVAPSPINPIHSRMCRTANRIPKAAVIMTQRKAPLCLFLGCPHSNQHGQAAGQEDERHHRNVGDAFERSRPVGCAVANEPVSDETAGEGRAVCDDEQPHRHLFCGNRECGRSHDFRRPGPRHLRVN